MSITYELNDKVELLVGYIRSLSGFVIDEALAQTEDHIGAIIVDAILQSGINYQQVVKPRVERLRTHHSEVRTTSGFLALTETVGLTTLIRWNGKVKTERILNVARFLRSEGVETRADLRMWLEHPGSVQRLKQLRGIGNMTADYFRMLAGIETIAPDGLINDFIKRAGLKASSYHDARAMLEKVARRLGVSPIVLGFAIWEYMARARKR